MPAILAAVAQTRGVAENGKIERLNDPERSAMTFSSKTAKQ
jgi:hypothetical protein